MNAIIRNLISVARRYKLAVVLNILGLSVAFAAFMVIMIQLHYDYRFDKCHKDSDRIFRAEFYIPQIAGTRVPLISRPIAERFIESSPHIVAGAITNSLMANFGGKQSFYAETDGERNYFEENILIVSPGYFDVFTFDFVEGSKDGHFAQGNVFIPQSVARRLFGNEPATGKQIVLSDTESQTVLGVYRDFPANSSVSNCIYFATPPDENKNDWGNWSYSLFIRVNDASNAPLIIENFLRNEDNQSVFKDLFDVDEADVHMYLTALPDIHFLTDIQYDFTPKASRQTLLILLTIAIVIIIIAAVNFINFSTALTPMRIKSINTRRVLGSRRSTMRRALVVEAVVICFMSYLVSLLFYSLFTDSPLSKLVDGDLSFAAHPLIIGGTALVAMLAGFFAGMYPARYMTSFAPALVLKGSFGLSPKGKKLRSTLIGIQYIASFALIIGVSFMYLQNRFMQRSSPGYNKDRLLTVDISKILGSRDAFTAQIKAYSGVEDVTYSRFLLSSNDEYMKWGKGYRGDLIMFQVLPVHYTFLEMMDIKVNDGRDFRQEDVYTQQGAYIFNEAARRQYGLELNTQLDDGGIITGFVPDIKFASFRVAVEPMAFFVWGGGYHPGIANIRLNKDVNLSAAVSYIHATLKEFDANHIFNVRFYDEVLQQVYEKEISLSTLISLFSLLAIFISIVGVFGLVVFDCECRRKEIGIRKICGASVAEILIMFNKAYFKILAICFVIAAPLAWYAVSRWMDNFAYKTPMYWWVYLLAFIALAVITVATITFQSWRVANDNPVNAIKCE
jgi:putative ABC transport system permease protein